MAFITHENIGRQHSLESGFRLFKRLKLGGGGAEIRSGRSKEEEKEEWD